MPWAPRPSRGLSSQEEPGLGLPWAGLPGTRPEAGRLGRADLTEVLQPAAKQTGSNASKSQAGQGGQCPKLLQCATETPSFYETTVRHAKKQESRTHAPGESRAGSGPGVPDARLHGPGSAPASVCTERDESCTPGVEGRTMGTSRERCCQERAETGKEPRKILEPRSPVARERDSRTGRRTSGSTWRSAKITEAENREEHGQEHGSPGGGRGAEATSALPGLGADVPRLLTTVGTQDTDWLINTETHKLTCHCTNAENQTPRRS